MRLALAVASSFLLAAFACSGPAQKKEGAVVETGPIPDNCCCKSNPLTSEDGKPQFDNANRMECSSKQGECVDEVQCAGKPSVEEQTPPSSPAVEPSTDESAPAVEKE